MSVSNDLPIDEPSEDKFGLDPFAVSIAASIANVAAPAGVVMAITGEWGSGKSSAINLIKHHLKPHIDAEKLALVSFNPWWFEGSDTLALSFFQQLNGAIGPSLPKQLRKSLSTLGQGVSSVGALAGALTNLHAPGFGTVVTAVTGLFGKLTGQTRTVETEHREISDALKKQDKRFLVVIDDIDRLNPDDVLTIFRLVKSVGRLPNVIYLLSLDRGKAERVVTERFPSEGASYLDKIIQGAFEIPPPLVDALRQEAVNSACEIMGVPSDAQMTRWWNVFADVVAPTIRTPRDVIRIGNQLSTTWPAVKDNVDRADFFAITALQLAEPIIYTAIREHPGEFCGPADRDNRRGLDQVYIDLLGLCGRPEREVERLKIGLRRLFPRLDAVWGNTYHDAEYWRRDRLIASTDHFRSYFAFAPSDGVLQADQINELIERADDQEYLAAQLREGLQKIRRDGSTLAALMLDELTVYAPQIEKAKVSSMVATIFSIADDLDVRSDQKTGFGFANNQLRLHWLLNRLVNDRFDLAEREEIYSQAIRSASLEWLCDFVERCLRYFEPRDSQDGPRGEAIVSQSVAEEFRSFCLEKVRSAAADGALLDHPKLTSILFAWLRLNARDAAEVRAWTDSQLGDSRFLVRMAREIPSEAWTQGMAFDAMGDRVARKIVRVDLSQYAEILDGD